MGYKGANVPRIDARSPGAGWLGGATAHGKRNGLLPRLFQSGGWAAPVIYRPTQIRAHRTLAAFAGSAGVAGAGTGAVERGIYGATAGARSEEHTSELQSREKLVCR